MIRKLHKEFVRLSWGGEGGEEVDHASEVEEGDEEDGGDEQRDGAGGVLLAGRLGEGFILVVVWQSDDE